MDQAKIIAQLSASLQYMKQNNLQHWQVIHNYKKRNELKVFRTALKIFTLTLLTEGTQCTFSFDKKNKNMLVILIDLPEGQKILSLKYPSADTVCGELCMELQADVNRLRESANNTF